MLLRRGVTKDLFPYLQSSDSGVRGLAAKSLGLLGAEEAVDQLQLLQQDYELVRFFEAGCVHSVSVAELASQALDTLASQEISR
jgi:HEAT repeat protein